MRILLYLIIIECFANCTQNQSRHNKNEEPPDYSQNIFQKDTTLNLYSATITLPKGWRLANDYTLPKVANSTARYRFHNKKNKLIYLEYGLSTIGNPAEPQTVSFRFRTGYVRNNVDTSDFIFTDNPILIKIRSNGPYRFFDNIVSGFSSTQYEPKKIGKGYSGVYIDSVGTIDENIADLSFYGENLDSEENAEMIQVIKTIQLKLFQ